MSGKKSADKKSINSYLIPLLLLGVMIIAILSSFGIQMINDAKNRVEEEYHAEVEGICNLYEKDIYAVEKVTDLIAGYLFDKEELINEENIDYVKKAADSIGAGNIYIIDTDYNAVDLAGKEYTKVNEKGVLSELFLKKSNTIRFFTDEDGKQAVYVLKSISSKTILRGYVVVKYVPHVMNDLTDNPKYSSKKSYMLVTADGYLVEEAGAKEYIRTARNDSIFEEAEKLMYLDGSFTSFRQSVYDCRTGSVQTIYQEVGKYSYISPINGVKAVVIMLVDTVDVERSFSVVSKSIRSMLLEIGITIVAFIAIIAGISLFNRAKYNIESENLQNKADTDLLTDLYNKMATERMIKEYLSGEGKNSVSMLFVIDVDNFKKINDTMGHAFGDQVLSQLGHQIRAWFRVNDIVGRIGGDEFMIFIKDVKDTNVIKREGSRVMQFFEGFNVGEYTRYSPTASVGGAVYPNDGTDFESLYKAADKAVYKSKKEGKNRVSFYGDLNALEKDAVTEKID